MKVARSDPKESTEKQIAVMADLLRRYEWLYYSEVSGMNYTNLAELVVMMIKGEFDGGQRFAEGAHRQARSVRTQG